MLVLCSNGLCGSAIITEMKKHISGMSSSAIVVTADNVYKEKNYHVPRCADELAQLGLFTDIIDIDVDSAANLLNYDVVEFIGGNPFYLMNSIRKSHAEPVLRNISDRKILIGWSAAVFVFGPSLELANEYTPEMNTVGLNDLRGLKLTNAEILPHYSRFINRFERFEERCAEYENKHNLSVIRLNDGDAVFINGQNQKLIKGSEQC